MAVRRMTSPAEMFIIRSTSRKLPGRGKSMTDRMATIPMPIRASPSETAFSRSVKRLCPASALAILIPPHPLFLLVDVSQYFCHSSVEFDRNCLLEFNLFIQSTCQRRIAHY